MHCLVGLCTGLFMAWQLIYPEQERELQCLSQPNLEGDITITFIYLIQLDTETNHSRVWDGMNQGRCQEAGPIGEHRGVSLPQMGKYQELGSLSISLIISPGHPMR